MSKLKARVRNISQKTKANAVVVSVMAGTANVRLSEGGRTLHGVRVVGGPVSVGDEVTLQYLGGEPIINAPGSSVATTTSAVTYAPLVQRSSGNPPTDPLTAAGWTIRADGVIYKNGVYIDPAGSIRLGSATGFLTGTGVFMGKDTDTKYKLHIGNPAGQHMYWNDTTLYVTGNFSGPIDAATVKTDNITDLSGGNLTIAPTGNIIINPTGNSVLPNTSYDINIGSTTKKYLTLHAAELRVETLVAQDTIATIGGRILVGPTTVLTSDTSAQTNLYANPGFETLGGGGADVFASWTETISDGAIVADTGSKHGGTYSAKITSGPTLDTRVEQYISCTYGYSYTFSFWTRGDGTNAGRYGVYSDGPSPWLVAVTSTGVTGTTWTRIQFTVTVPASTTAMSIILYGPSVNGGYAQHDDVLVTRDLIWVKHNEMAAGDYVYLEADGKVEWMKILSAASGGGPYVYEVARDLDGSGVNSWYQGDAVFNTGAVGEGYLDLYSIRGIRNPSSSIGPTVTGVYRWGNTYNSTSEVWAIGNLNGLYGYSSNIYGIGLGFYGWGYSHITAEPTNGIRMSRLDSLGGYHQMGKWANDGTITVGEVGTNLSNVIISTSGIELREGSNTRIKLDTSGNALFGRADGTYANMYWEASSSKLQFRSGTTVKSYIGTDGSFNVNALDGGVYDRTTAITWLYSSSDIATLGAYVWSAGGHHGCELRTLAVSGRTSGIELSSTSPTTKNAQVLIMAKSGTTSTKLSLDNNDTTPTSKANFTGSLFYFGTNTAACDIVYSGKMTFWASTGLQYDTAPFHPLSTALTSTSWDGDPHSTTGKTSIDLSAVFGAPAGIKAVAVRLYARDSGSYGSTTAYFGISPNNSSGSLAVTTRPAGVVNDCIIETAGICPCDANGDIYYQITATGTDTMDCWLEIWGYFI